MAEWFKHWRSYLLPRSLASNVVFTAVAFAISRLLGLVREIIIASRFGTGETFDAYVAAFRIPDLIFAIVMSGAFGSAFIPVFSGFLARDNNAKALRLVNALLTYTLIVLSLASILAFTFAGPLITTIVAPDLSAEGQRTAIDLTRLFLLSPLLLGLAAAGKGMLEARGNFMLPAIAPIIYNLGIIAGAILLTPIWGIYGLASGVFLGAAGTAIVQVGWLLRKGYRFAPLVSRHVDGLAKVGRMLAGRMGTQLVAHANLIVTTSIASSIGAGAISSVYYAQHLVMLPHGIIAMSLSTVMFPTLSRHFELGETAQFRHTLVRGLSSLIMLAIPVLLVLVIFRTSVTQVLLRYGEFDKDSTRMVSVALGVYALSLIFRILIEPLMRAFYARGNTRTPMVILIVTTASHILFGWVLAREFGIAGLMASLSFSTALRMILMLWWLNRHIDNLVSILWQRIIPLVLPSLVALTVALLLAAPLKSLTDPAETHRLIGYASFSLCSGFVFGTYGVLTWRFGSPDVREVFARIGARVGVKR